MVEAALWAFAGAVSLLIGMEVAFLLRPSRQAIGLVMAFGAGAMISAVAFELVDDALASGERITVALGLGAARWRSSSATC